MLSFAWLPRMSLRVVLFSFVLCAATVSLATAQRDRASSDEDATDARHAGKSSPVVIGNKVTLDSRVLDETRTLNIFFPPSYQRDTEKTYPTIYLLDGGIDEDYHHQTGLVQFLVMYQLMPESIVVGIANTDRKRDMTHPTSDEEELKEIPTSGGSAKFLAFIERELQPFIAEHYRVGVQRTVIGQSLGALLATEALITKPELFDNYIIVSPSLYWSKQELISKLDDFLKSNPDLNRKVFLALGKEHPLMHETMDRFVAGLRKHAPPGLKWKFVSLPHETHATVMHRATYQGYEFFHGDEYKGL